MSHPQKHRKFRRRRKVGSRKRNIKRLAKKKKMNPVDYMKMHMEKRKGSDILGGVLKDVLKHFQKNEGKLTEGGREIAKTILQQLGGNKFIAMTGAKNLGFTGKGISMKIGKNAKGVTHVTIDLDRGKDLYNIEFIKIRGPKRTTVKKLKGIYADQLKKSFTQYTGLRVSL